MELYQAEVRRVIEGALEEDLAWGDVTTDFLIDPSWQARASVLAKEEGVLAGLGVFALVLSSHDPTLKTHQLLKDGAQVRAGQVVALAEGPAASLLRAERVALNFLQRLSGIATETSRYVQAVAGLPVRIIDTRKTTPGLRLLEKYAVRVGGGFNHRMSLSDGALIKDNHLAALRARGLALRDVVARVRAMLPHPLKIELEVESAQEAEEAAQAGADIILLDNMGIEEMRQAVKLVAGRALTQASGGVKLENVRAVAETGVDLISVGALTHSSRWLNFSLEFESY